MRSVFVGHFRPSQKDFAKLWDECIFAVDANVLLNLYRYSPNTRKQLEKSLTAIKDRVFIAHQAAKEFLKNRLSVTAGQANEYSKSIKSMQDLLSTLSSKDRHPFLPDSELPKFKTYTEELVSILEDQQKSLYAKLTDDEILDFIETLFEGKTGQPFDSETMITIKTEGMQKYENEIPPGYRDIKKDSPVDPYRKYGDLIVWKQIIEHAKSEDKPLVFITDDKKKDWWLEQSGRTIAPRPELIEEFFTTTKQSFWMYTVEKFIQESAKIAKADVSDEVIKEIIKISQDAKNQTQDDSPSIELSQESFKSSADHHEGLLTVTLTRPMKYATGTGKFIPKFTSIPKFKVSLIHSPYENTSWVGVSSGCGTNTNFNVHIKGRRGLLEAGDYVFKYEAHETKYTEESSSELVEQTTAYRDRDAHH